MPLEDVSPGPVRDGRTDSGVILLSSNDNVVVAVRSLSAGEHLLVDGKPITVKEPVARGHKLARSDIKEGDKIVKYGAPIGSSTRSISVGEHVHVHNVKSDYTATHLIGTSAPSGCEHEP